MPLFSRSSSIGELQSLEKSSFFEKRSQKASLCHSNLRIFTLIFSFFSSFIGRILSPFSTATSSQALPSFQLMASN
jgi:hypothetical protein